MKSTNILFPSLVLGIAGGFVFSGCVEQKQSPTAEIDTLKKDTTVYLQAGKETPSCKISISYAYLKPASDKDSVSLLINSEIQKEAFGQQYAALSPEAFVTTLTNDFIQNYHTDVKDLFEADMHNGMKAEDVPAWYNYEYQISTTLEAGLDSSVWNYSAVNFQYTGGAHPNTYAKYLNFDAKTGKVLTADEVFSKEGHAKICSLILKELIKETNKKMETDTITSVEGLQSVGILLDTDIYIPENFLLGKDGVTFYYNRYEIAPYSAGDFSLTVPYDEISAYLK
ncbi:MULTISPECIES: RsiV family protein [unclassified Phocaeicola]|jgi:hypothetical protein|uniref:RsiV family protein n=1 Tax=unclassified Phocaeicola TaxID=2762211 RepID=UPI0003401679|nr:uncharacterized protein BN461_01773 [Bacteroides sp. CAG:1076]